MNVPLKIAAIIGGYSLASTYYVARYKRRMNRRKLFALAQQRAKATGKPLIVIGDPDAGIINSTRGRDYGCGSLCIDINGCPKCPNQLKIPIEEWLQRQDGNSAVLFVSCVLEYVQTDVRKIISELQRVSGGDLFVVTVEPWTYTAFFYKGAQRRFFSAPPYGSFRWQELW
jgi:hypothetical protein